MTGSGLPLAARSHSGKLFCGIKGPTRSRSSSLPGARKGVSKMGLTSWYSLNLAMYEFWTAERDMLEADIQAACGAGASENGPTAWPKCPRTNLL